MASGEVVVVGTLVCVALNDIANTKSGGLATGGVYELTAINTGAFTHVSGKVKMTHLGK